MTGPLVMVQAVFAARRAGRVPRLPAGPRGHLGRGQPQARPGPAGGARAPGPAGRGAGLARRAVGRRDRRPGRPGVHRHQPAAGRAGQRAGSGVDLARALVEVARSGTSRPQPPGRPGVADAPAAAGDPRARPSMAGAAASRASCGTAAAPRGLPGQPRGADAGRRRPARRVPVALTALATLARPAAWRSFTSGSTGAYSLTPAAWEELRQAGAAVGPVPPGAEAGAGTRHGPFGP